jgi:hypothetical protein
MRKLRPSWAGTMPKLHKVAAERPQSHTGAVVEPGHRRVNFAGAVRSNRPEPRGQSRDIGCLTGACVSLGWGGRIRTSEWRYQNTQSGLSKALIETNSR